MINYGKKPIKISIQDVKNYFKNTKFLNKKCRYRLTGMAPPL